MYAKWVQKSMDFEVENQEKVIKKGFKNMTFFLHGFFTNFGRILEGLGRVLGRFWGAFWSPKRVPKGETNFMFPNARFQGVLGGSWEGLGRVLGGFWEGLGRVLGGVGGILGGF